MKLFEGVRIDHATHAYLTGDVAQLTRSAFQKQGGDAFAMTKRSTCYHEAGHAVIFACHGLGVQNITIKREAGDHWSGVTYADQDTRVIHSSSDRGDIERQARIEISGVQAEVIFDTSDARFGSALYEVAQFRLMCSFLARQNGDPFEMICFRIAMQVATVLKLHETAVHAIAAALKREHRIRGPKLASILADVKPYRFLDEPPFAVRSG